MKKTAKAAIYTGIGKPFEIREYPLTPPRAGMASLELIASGICGTDLHIHAGKIPLAPPKIIGHEFIGRIAAISEEDQAIYGVRTGDAAIVDIACPCGECLLCQTGDDANCIDMQVTNGGNPETPPHFYGGYAEYNYSPVKNLIKIPPEIDPVTACVFPCAGPTALHAFQLAKKAGVEAAHIRTAVVQGLGPVGMFAVIYLASLGVANIVAVTSRERKERDALAFRFGASHVFSLEKMDAAEIGRQVKALSRGAGADLVFEASGNPQAIPQGMELLRNRGVYLIPGQYSNSGGIEILPQTITFRALHIIGSSQYSICDVKAYLDFLIRHPALHEAIRSLASCYPMQEINQAFADAKSGKNIKTMIVK
ncbi:MAG: zinc-binding dehydrogenase [Clostridia bacterium]